MRATASRLYKDLLHTQKEARGGGGAEDGGGREEKKGAPPSRVHPGRKAHLLPGGLGGPPPPSQPPGPCDAGRRHARRVTPGRVTHVFPPHTPLLPPRSSREGPAPLLSGGGLARPPRLGGEGSLRGRASQLQECFRNVSGGGREPAGGGLHVRGLLGDGVPPTSSLHHPTDFQGRTAAPWGAGVPLTPAPRCPPATGGDRK